MKVESIIISICMMTSFADCSQNLKKQLSVNPADNENFFYNEFWYLKNP